MPALLHNGERLRTLHVNASIARPSGDAPLNVRCDRQSAMASDSITDTDRHPHSDPVPVDQ
jgi:hypothetical protein